MTLHFSAQESLTCPTHKTHGERTREHLRHTRTHSDYMALRRFRCIICGRLHYNLIMHYRHRENVQAFWKTQKPRRAANRIDLDGAAVWRKIARAIGELQRKELRDGEVVH